MVDPAALLGLHQASLGYQRGTPVLAGVDLTLRAGDFVGVEGPNGAGKSTLLRSLLGLLPPLAGTLEESGARIGYVPQKERLDPLFPLSVHEVVSLGCLHRPPMSRITEAISAVELDRQLRVPFSQLSGGQRQRALLARALVQEPQLLALDEPTVGVDEESLARIEAVLRDRHSAGTAIVLVSHDAGLLARCAHTFWHVCTGEVLERSRPGVLHAPDEEVHGVG